MVGTAKPLDDPRIPVNILVPDHGIVKTEVRKIEEIECGDSA